MIVLDSSALLALFNNEVGADVVKAVFTASTEDVAMSAVNYAEVVSKLTDAGLDVQSILDIFAALPIQILPFDEDQALASGLLRQQTKVRGLSLGDRACLALGKTQQATVFTADQIWQQLVLDIDVQCIRA